MYYEINIITVSLILFSVRLIQSKINLTFLTAKQGVPIPNQLSPLSIAETWAQGHDPRGPASSRSTFWSLAAHLVHSTWVVAMRFSKREARINVHFSVFQFQLNCCCLATVKSLLIWPRDILEALCWQDLRHYLLITSFPFICLMWHTCKMTIYICRCLGALAKSSVPFTVFDIVLALLMKSRN